MVLLGLKFVFARVRRTRKQTSAMEVIVIVDPISTGARMAEVASSRGFRVVSLRMHTTDSGSPGRDS